MSVASWDMVATAELSRRRKDSGHIKLHTPCGRLERVVSPDYHECRREAFETEARRGFSHVRPTEAYVQSVEEPNEETPPARGSE